jgi:alpha/beta superfamily hydrolase
MVDGVSGEPGVRIGAQTVLPAERRPFQVRTRDGLSLVGECALPAGGRLPRGTVIMLHPLPTEGGSMDSHLIRKAAWRLPALAGIAVVRFNTRGTCSRSGCSEGEFGHGDAEAADLAAVVGWAAGQDLPEPWLVGWSFGSEVALMHGSRLPVRGVVAISPPLKRTRSEHLLQWAVARKPVTALVPELDQFLRPAEARARFAMLPSATVLEGEGAVHLWIGEKSVRQVLEAVVDVVIPGFGPLPNRWDGPSEIHQNRSERKSS